MTRHTALSLTDTVPGTVTRLNLLTGMPSPYLRVCMAHAAICATDFRLQYSRMIDSLGIKHANIPVSPQREEAAHDGLLHTIETIQTIFLQYTMIMGLPDHGTTLRRGLVRPGPR